MNIENILPHEKLKLENPTVCIVGWNPQGKSFISLHKQNMSSETFNQVFGRYTPSRHISLAEFFYQYFMKKIVVSTHHHNFIKRIML